MKQRKPKVWTKRKLDRSANRILAKSGFFAKAKVVTGKIDPDSIGVNGRLKVSHYAGRAS